MGETSSAMQVIASFMNTGQFVSIILLSTNETGTAHWKPGKGIKSLQNPVSY